MRADRAIIIKAMELPDKVFELDKVGNSLCGLADSKSKTMGNTVVAQVVANLRFEPGSDPILPADHHRCTITSKRTDSLYIIYSKLH